MTAAERSELAAFRQEMNDRFDETRADIKEIDTRVRSVESFVNQERGRRETQQGYSSSRLQWIGIAMAVAVLLVAVPAAAVAVIHLVAVLGA